MRVSGMMVLLGVVACSSPGVGNRAGGTAVSDPPASFAGTWEACEGATSPAECSRYTLLQRGERICGTWFYVASGKAYEGRLIARATSALEARRTHICGRPGSEAGTECEDGWDVVDRPLLLCAGGLADAAGADGRCLADYRSVPASRSGHAALTEQSWVQDCLSTDP